MAFQAMIHGQDAHATSSDRPSASQRLRAISYVVSRFATTQILDMGSGRK